jgi:hypothetical protein
MNTVQTFFTSLLSDTINNREVRDYRLSKYEWDDLYQEAIAHQVDTIIFPRVSQLLKNNKELAKIAESWKYRYLLSIMEHKKQCLIVPDILRAFNEANIDLIMLKGYVIKDVYSNPYDRLMGDLDLLVRIPDWDNAVKVIKSFGYEENLSVEHSCTANFHHPTAINIELHHTLAKETLFPQIGILEQALWDNAIEYFVEGQRILIPAKDDFVFYLFLHLAKHFAGDGFGFRLLADLTLYIEKNKKFLSAEIINKYIDLFELRLIVSHILRLCRELLDLDFILPSQDISDESYNFFLQSVFDAGIFGYKSTDNIKDNIYRNFLKSGIKSFWVYKLWHIYFPPASSMNIKYAYARNRQFLLPFAWLHRAVDVIGNKGFGYAKLYGRPDDITKSAVKMAYLQQFNLLDRPHKG